MCCISVAGCFWAPFCPAGEPDGEALEMAFSKKKVEDRKQWLQSYAPGTFLDHSVDTISYSEFVHKVGWRQAGSAAWGSLACSI